MIMKFSIIGSGSNNFSLAQVLKTFALKLAADTCETSMSDWECPRNAYVGAKATTRLWSQMSIG